MYLISCITVFDLLPSSASFQLLLSNIDDSNVMVLKHNALCLTPVRISIDALLHSDIL
jgi:hypothetical protein